MLVLTRRVDEEIVIAESIIVKVIAVKGKYVKLGIQAPVNIAVHRSEVHDLIQKQREETQAS